MYASLGANLSRYAMSLLGMVFPFFGSDIPGRFAGPTSHCQDKGILRTIVPDWR